jgi:hypothetical protein
MWMSLLTVWTTLRSLIWADLVQESRTALWSRIPGEQVRVTSQVRLRMARKEPSGATISMGIASKWMIRSRLTGISHLYRKIRPSGKHMAQSHS